VILSDSFPGFDLGFNFNENTEVADQYGNKSHNTTYSLESLLSPPEIGGGTTLTTELIPPLDEIKPDSAFWPPCTTPFSQPPAQQTSQGGVNLSSENLPLASDLTRTLNGAPTPSRVC
jgi:hypothetical protein